MRRLAAGVALLLLLMTGPVALAADPLVDVCTRSPDALAATRDAEAEELGRLYGASPGKALHRTGPSCDWICGASAVSGRKTCMDRLEHLLAYSCDRPDHQQGRDTTDEQYYKDVESRWAFRGGPILAAPEWLVSAATGSGRGNDVPASEFTAKLRERNVKYVEYASTSVQNDGKSFRRILVLLEGEKFDQWIQIATSADGKVLSRNVDLISVEKKDPASGANLVRPNVYFKGFSRNPANHTLEAEGMPGSVSKLTRCYSCHSSGLRTVIPNKLAPVTSYPPTALEYFQGLMARAPMGLGPSYDPALDGPPMGAGTSPAGTVRTTESRLETITKSGCAIGLDKAARRKVAESMSCAQCHTGRNGDRGILNAGTDPGTIQHKIAGAGLATRAYMPPVLKEADGDTALTLGEKAALVSCLRAEYAQDLKEWVKQLSCSAPDQQPCPPAQQDSTKPLGGGGTLPILKVIQDVN